MITPAPRVGDKVGISILFQQADLKPKKGKKSKEERLEDYENILGHGDLSFNKILLDVGDFTIGPFKFSINGKEVVSDILKIRVYEKLPTIKDGLWLRFVSRDEKDLIILEQRVSNKWEPNNANSIDHGSEVVIFAELDQEIINELGFELRELMSRTSNEITNKGARDSGTSSYKITIYKIVKTNGSGKLKLNKELFKNYPNDIQLTIE